MRRRWIRAAVLLLGLAGCAPYALVEPKERVVKDVYIVTPQIKWNSQAAGEWDTWTQDGPRLDSLTFFSRVADGKPLVVQPKRLMDDEKKFPVFKKSMSEIEAAELIETTISMHLQVPVTSGNLAPAVFGGTKGFRFSFEYVGKDEVEREGIAYGSVKGDALYVVVFQGTKLYHFARYRPDAEKLIESLRLK